MPNGTKIPSFWSVSEEGDLLRFFAYILYKKSTWVQDSQQHCASKIRISDNNMPLFVHFPR